MPVDQRKRGDPKAAGNAGAGQRAERGVNKKISRLPIKSLS
jgi:hypothetical protein